MMKKIFILLASTIALFSLWLLGLEKVYAHILKFGISQESIEDRLASLEYQRNLNILAISQEKSC